MFAELLTEPDRNKTELTHVVTEAAMRYLDGLGFKPVETEVPIREGWVADVAGVAQLTYTEAVGMKLIKARPRCDYDRYNRDAEYRQRHDALNAYVDSAYASLPDPLTALVEVKTSRADFKSDRKWTAEPPANLCYLAVPRGMLSAHEYPKGWHVVEVYESGVVSIATRGELFTVSLEQQLRTVLALAVRRDHFTRHARLRADQKAERIRQNGEQSLIRMRKAVRALKQIVKGEGESVEQVLSWESIGKLPPSLIEELRTLWGRGSDRWPPRRAERRLVVGERFRFVSDEDCHDYLIPAEKKEAFDKWLEHQGKLWGEPNTEEEFKSIEAEYEGEDFTDYKIDAHEHYTFEKPEAD